MDPEVGTAFGYLREIYYKRIVADYVSVTPARKGRVSFRGDYLIKYALRMLFYIHVESAHYYWGARVIQDALGDLEIYTKSRYDSSQCDDSDNGDRFLCDEHIQAYKRELRREARKRRTERVK